MKIDIKKLTAIDLSELSELITYPESQGYFRLPEGREHYKLLAYLSMQFDGITISDIGTYHGCSALALSINPNNRVISYDIISQLRINKIPENVMFSLIGRPFDEDILDSKLIVLDTTHDGTHEDQVVDFLIGKGWKGVLVLDDIHHFPEQNKLWESTTLPKEDLTKIGHWSGTGLIHFK